MKAIAILVAAVALPGCSTLGTVNQAVLQQGKPIIMCSLAGEAYVVQSGLPVPVGQRLEEANELCLKIGARPRALVEVKP